MSEGRERGLCIAEGVTRLMYGEVSNTKHYQITTIPEVVLQHSELPLQVCELRFLLLQLFN